MTFARPPRPVRGAMWTVVLSIITFGCGPVAPVTTPPRVVIDRYVTALKKADFKTAYRMMNKEFRQRYSEAKFTSMAQDDPLWLKQCVEQFSKPAGQVKVSAVVRHGKDGKILLVREKGVWRIATDPTRFYSQKSQSEALRSFVRAVEARRWEVVLRFVPAKWSRTMTVAKLKKRWGDHNDKQGIAPLMDRIKPHLDDPIQQTGDRATLSLSEHSEVTFVREEGVWKIEDAY